MVVGNNRDVPGTLDPPDPPASAAALSGSRGILGESASHSGNPLDTRTALDIPAVLDIPTVLDIPAALDISAALGSGTSPADAMDSRLRAQKGGVAEEPEKVPFSHLHLRSSPREKPIEILVLGDDEAGLPNVSVALRSNRGWQLGRSDARGRCIFHGVALDDGAELTLMEVDSAAWAVRASCPLVHDATKPAEWGPEAKPKSAPTLHKVEPGECLYLLACQYGFTAEQLWGHPENKWSRFHSKAVVPLREIHIPVRTTRWHAVSAGHMYLIRRLGTHVSMRIRLLQASGGPMADCAYTLALTLTSGQQLPHRIGRTDSLGNVRAYAPTNINRGLLDVSTKDGRSRRSFALSFGTLPPADEPHGMEARLSNLGWARTSDDLPRSDITAEQLFELHLS